MSLVLGKLNMKAKVYIQSSSDQSLKILMFEIRGYKLIIDNTKLKMK